MNEHIPFDPVELSLMEVMDRTIILQLFADFLQRRGRKSASFDREIEKFFEETREMLINAFINTAGVMSKSESKKSENVESLFDVLGKDKKAKPINNIDGNVIEVSPLTALYIDKVDGVIDMYKKLVKELKTKKYESRGSKKVTRRKG